MCAQDRVRIRDGHDATPEGVLGWGLLDIVNAVDLDLATLEFDYPKERL